MRILIVDDSPPDLEAATRMIRNMIQDVGIKDTELFQARTLAETLIHLDDQAFDLVVLDLTLPDSPPGGGINTFFAVHAKAGAAAVVINSGQDDPKVGFEMVNAGAFGVLVKGAPNPHDLQRVILQAIARSNARHAPTAAEEKSLLKMSQHQAALERKPSASGEMAAVSASLLEMSQKSFRKQVEIQGTLEVFGAKLDTTTESAKRLEKIIIGNGAQGLMGDVAELKATIRRSSHRPKPISDPPKKSMLPASVRDGGKPLWVAIMMACLTVMGTLATVAAAAFKH